MMYTDGVAGYLKQVDIPNIEAIGYYKGVREIRFIVPAKYESMVQALAADYNQESYLYLDSNNLATLHEPSGKLIQVLGRMSEVKNVDGLDAYTTVSGRHFVAGGI